MNKDGYYHRKIKMPDWEDANVAYTLEVRYLFSAISVAKEHGIQLPNILKFLDCDIIEWEYKQNGRLIGVVIIWQEKIKLYLRINLLNNMVTEIRLKSKGNVEYVR